jgi:glycine cleavage system aminomethyltransferase T
LNLVKLLALQDDKERLKVEVVAMLPAVVEGAPREAEAIQHAAGVWSQRLGVRKEEEGVVVVTSLGLGPNSLSSVAVGVVPVCPS